MDNKVIEKRLKLIPYKYFFIDGKTFESIHNSKENAITMLMEMSEFGDNISLNYDALTKEYKVKMML